LAVNKVDLSLLSAFEKRQFLLTLDIPFITKFRLAQSQIKSEKTSKEIWRSRKEGYLCTPK
jgi:hypothetical protein